MTTRTMVRRVAALVLVAIVAAACGGGDKKTSAGEFADATCVDLANWATTIQTAFEDLQGLEDFDPGDLNTAESVLGKLNAALADADQATAKLVSGISSRPAPDIASGEDIKSSLVTALNKLRDVLTSTRTRISNFDVRTATPDDADKLKSDLDGLENSVGEALAGLTPLNDNNELKAAFEGSETCKQAGSGLFSSGE